MFRPMKPDGSGVERRHLDRKTPWRLVKKYCKAAGIDPDRLDGRGIGIHSLRKTAINDAIRNGATLHEVREFAGHADIRTTELYFVRRRRTPSWRRGASTSASRGERKKLGWQTWVESLDFPPFSGRIHAILWRRQAKSTGTTLLSTQVCQPRKKVGGKRGGLSGTANH